MTNTLGISNEQYQQLQQFRSNVVDVLNEMHDDYFLLRWLRARKWDLTAAEKMLRAHLKTRAMWNIDHLWKWNAPLVLRNYLPYGMVGYDNEGSPIIVVPLYNFDIYGMLHSVSRMDFQRYVIKLLEELMTIAYESSKAYGISARQLVVLFDVTNFSFKQYTWRPAAEFVISMIKQYEQNYPEVLKICYVINAPKIFSVAYNFVKRFLDECTMSKINIYQYGCDKWKEDFFSNIDPCIIPKCFGGNYIENGNEKCPNMIVWGGKIPKQMYLNRNDDTDDTNKDFIETVILKGKKLKLEYDVEEQTFHKENNVLSWHFRTFDYDIKFGIYSIDNATGEKRGEVDLRTVYSNEMDEIGFIPIRSNTKYTVVFDNSNSYFRNKRIRYYVTLGFNVDETIDLPLEAYESDS